MQTLPTEQHALQAHAYINFAVSWSVGRWLSWARLGAPAGSWCREFEWLAVTVRIQKRLATSHACTFQFLAFHTQVVCSLPFKLFFFFAFFGTTLMKHACWDFLSLQKSPSDLGAEIQTAASARTGVSKGQEQGAETTEDTPALNLCATRARWLAATNMLTMARIRASNPILGGHAHDVPMSAVGQTAESWRP